MKKPNLKYLRRVADGEIKREQWAVRNRHYERWVGGQKTAEAYRDAGLVFFGPTRFWGATLYVHLTEAGRKVLEEAELSAK